MNKTHATQEEVSTSEPPEISLKAEEIVSESEPDCIQEESLGDVADEENRDDKATEPALSADELQALLLETRSQVQREQENVLRARAEVENLRRRASRDVENAHKFGLERLISELLPVIDSLELGLRASNQEGASVESLHEGGKLTLKMFLAALEKFSLQVIEPVDASFDPELHQAISIQESDSRASGTVLQVVQKGYTLSGRLVRPAMVIVAK